MVNYPSLRVARLFTTVGLAWMTCSSVGAQTHGPNGFFYPVASLNPTATFLQTGCHGYIADEYHLGWDLLQNHGTPVYAITDGTIVNITNTGDPDVTFIWIRHQAVNPSTGSLFTFWAVYGHTSIKPGLANGNNVHGGDVIGYTIVYTPSVDHCHFGVNLNGIITTVSNFHLSYVSRSGSNSSATIQAGWGRGSLPNDWCGHDSQNLPLLQTSGGVENFTDPQAFLNSNWAVGYNGGSLNDIYVDGSYTGTQIGTASQPFNNVTAAINAASTTQPVTIHIKPNTYHESIAVHKNIHFVTNGSGTVRIGN